MTQVGAARTFGVSRQAIANWLRAYARGGTSALRPRKRGPKDPGRKLRGWQAATVRNLIRDRHPEQLKLPFVLWTSDAVRQLIWNRFQVRLAARSVRRYLQIWGFAPQKPRRAAYERDAARVKRWIDEHYPQLRARAKKEKALILWGDAMGMRSDHRAGRSYSPRGMTPITQGTGQRFGANMFSAITNRGEQVFMVFKKRFTTAVFMRFLRRLIKQIPKKVFLVIGRHPVRRRAAVRDRVAGHRGKIEIFFLPGYSPDLSPGEMPNQDVKANAVGKKRPCNQRQLMRSVRNDLAARRRNAHPVKRSFHADTVRRAT
jgi:transposase